MDYIKLMRIKHYIKNVLIFMPLIFAMQLTTRVLLYQTLYGFFVFSLIASSIYIINDIRDIEKDRKHHIKKMRPIASGKIKVSYGIGFMCFLLLIAVILNSYIANKMNAWVVLVCYFVINLFYSFGLKNIPLIDVIIIVIGFLLRLMYGGIITNIEISNWLYLTIISISFYFALGKRRNEIIKCGVETRNVLNCYNLNFLDKNMYMFLGLTIAFYSLWCMSAQISEHIIWTIPLVIIMCMKYSMNVEGDSSGDPADVILADKVLIALAVLYGIIILFMIYI